jgi:peptidoglycan/LPS O-acetylase OafA/YrhL
VLFHAFPTLVPGDVVEMDVCFVVSGWLIGGVVFAEQTRR